jgi:LmbE family N-acetylglucosaminyl deacetylase
VRVSAIRGEPSAGSQNPSSESVELSEIPTWSRGEPTAVPELSSEPPPGRRVLILAAHADDETFGCGGALALHARRGDDLLLAVLTRGDRGDPEGLYRDTDYVELRRDEARAAAADLGIQDVRFFDYPDQMGTEGRHLLPDLARDVQGLVDEFGPDLVYHPWAGEAHPDHWILALATEDVARKTSPEVLFVGYEIWSVFLPDLVVDVGPVYDRKEAAMSRYESQLRYYDYVPICHALDTYRTLFWPTARYCEAFVRRRGGSISPAEPGKVGLLQALFRRPGSRRKD